MRISAFPFLLCLSLAILPIRAFGQTDFGYLDQSKQIFYADHAAFREESGETFGVELYYKILTDALTFVKYGERFRASYEVQVVVSNKINKQVTGTSIEEDYIVDSYEETRSPSDFLINQLILSLYSGRYKLRMKLVDRNSGTSFELERDFKRITMAKNYLSSGGYSLEVLTELYGLVPDDLCLNDIKFDQAGTFSVKGISKSISTVYTFVDGMEGSKHFCSVRTKRTTKRAEKGEEVVDFEIMCTLEKEKVGEEK